MSQEAFQTYSYGSTLPREILHDRWMFIPRVRQSFSNVCNLKCASPQPLPSQSPALMLLRFLPHALSLSKRPRRSRSKYPTIRGSILSMSMMHVDMSHFQSKDMDGAGESMPSRALPHCRNGSRYSDPVKSFNRPGEIVQSTRLQPKQEGFVYTFTQHQNIFPLWWTPNPRKLTLTRGIDILTALKKLVVLVFLAELGQILYVTWSIERIHLVDITGTAVETSINRLGMIVRGFWGST